MDATGHLQNLRSELTSRSWKAEVCTRRGAVLLHVQNPAAPRLDDEVVCDGEAFRWEWGQGIGPVAEVAKVADRIQYVLREVTETRLQWNDLQEAINRKYGQVRGTKLICVMTKVDAATECNSLPAASTSGATKNRNPMPSRTGAAIQTDASGKILNRPPSQVREPDLPCGSSWAQPYGYHTTVYMWFKNCAPQTTTKMAPLAHTGSARYAYTRQCRAVPPRGGVTRWVITPDIDRRGRGPVRPNEPLIPDHAVRATIDIESKSLPKPKRKGPDNELLPSLRTTLLAHRNAENFTDRLERGPDDEVLLLHTLEGRLHVAPVDCSARSLRVPLC